MANLKQRFHHARVCHEQLLSHDLHSHEHEQAEAKKGLK